MKNEKKEPIVVKQEDITEMLTEIMKDEMKKKKRMYVVAFIIGIIITVVLAGLWSWGVWQMLFVPLLGFTPQPFVAIFLVTLSVYFFIFVVYDLLKALTSKRGKNV